MCVICDRIQMIREGRNPYFVRELETGYAVIGDHQYFRGYTLFLCKQHVTELYDLEPAFRAQYLAEMTQVAQAAAEAFGAEKMNYECLGNGDAHVHWHLFPRRSGDLGAYVGDKVGGPVWWVPIDRMNDDRNRPDEAELKALCQALGEALDRITGRS